MHIEGPDLLDVLRWLSEHNWTPPSVTIVILGAVLYSRWKRRYRKPSSLLFNREIATALIVCAVFSAGYYAYFYRYWGLPEKFDRHEVGILIAEVPGDVAGKEQQAYALAIEDLAQKTPDLKGVLRVKLLQRPLPVDPELQHQKAIQIGKWVRASYVVRPYEINGVQQPWLSVVGEPWSSRSEAPMAAFSNFDFAKLGDLLLPRQIILMAQCTIAASLYNARLYARAATEFASVLASPQLPEVAPSRPNLNLWLGNSLFQSGKPGDAEQPFRTAIRLQPDLADAHSGLGATLAVTRHLDAALPELVQAIKIDPDDPDPYNNECAIFLMKRDYVDATPLCKHAVDLLKRPSSDTHSNYCAALSGNGDYTAATDECHLALEQNPNSAAAHFNLGVILDNTGRPDEAYTEYQKSIQFDDKFPQVYDQLGKQLEEKSSYDEAETQFRKSIQLDPDFADTHFDLARLYEKKKQQDDAVKEYLAAINCDPKSYGAHLNVGLIYQMRGQFDNAIQHYRAAIKMKPQEPAPRINLGFLFLSQNRYREAISVYSEELTLLPDNTIILSYLGSAFDGLGQSDKAIQYCEKALKPDQHNAVAQLCLGIAYGQKKNLAVAIPYLQEAAQLSPDTGGTWMYLCTYLGRARRYDEAQEPCSKALKAYPDNAECQRILKEAKRRVAH